MATVKTAEIQQYFREVSYPAGKQELLAQAEELGADDDVLEMIALLPDQQYESPADVSLAIEESVA